MNFNIKATMATIGPGRIIFVNFDQEKPSVCFAFPKSDAETLENIRKAIEAARLEGEAKFGGNFNPPANKIALKDGDVEKADDPKFAGMYYLNCSSKFMPGVVGVNMLPGLEKLEPLTPEAIYPGVNARLSVNFFPYNFNGNKGISAGLNLIQVLGGGERLGRIITAEEAFGGGFSAIPADMTSNDDYNSIFN